MADDRSGGPVSSDGGSVSTDDGPIDAHGSSAQAGVGPTEAVAATSPGLNAAPRIEYPPAASGADPSTAVIERLRAASSSSHDGRRRRLGIVTAIAVILAILGFSAGRAAGTVPWLGGQGDDTAAVTALTDDFLRTYNTYDVSKIEDYQDRMRPLLTDRYFGQFTEVTDSLFKALEQRQQTSGNVKVLTIGLSALDDDSATALAAVDSEVTAGATEAVRRPMRWKVDLVKQDGTWKVDNSEVVAPSQVSDAVSPGEGGESSGEAP